MNAFSPFDRGLTDPFANPLDALLARVAINLQLPPGLHAKACRRYEAVRKHIERPGSPLAGRVIHFYPQGSMAIDATISMRGTDEDYDLDIVAELELFRLSPGQILDLLEKALEGYPAQVVRQTRCVTVQYADGMHLDITPAIRTPSPSEKRSHICHAKPGVAREHQFVAMNAWGFAQWYVERTPEEQRFAEAFNSAYYAADSAGFLVKADVHEVPDQTHLAVKSTTTVALQLLKRFRNIVYQDNEGRVPPSVLLSCHAGLAAKVGMTLSDMLIRQALWTETEIRRAARLGRLLNVRNPVWQDDDFTDRWPENMSQQIFFADRLGELAAGLERAKRGDVQLEDLSTWLRDLFGARVVGRAVEAFNAGMGNALQAGGQRYTPGGGLYVPSKPALLTGAGVVAAVSARAHTNMGERR